MAMLACLMRRPLSVRLKKPQNLTVLTALPVKRRLPANPTATLSASDTETSKPQNLTVLTALPVKWFGDMYATNK